MNRWAINFLLIFGICLTQMPSQARWYEPTTGRFRTMDSFEGTSAEPATLHKYSYCSADPVNKVDPTGEFTDAISFNTSAAIGIGLVGLTATAVIEAKTHAIGNLMTAAFNQTTAGAGAIVDAAESALSVARTSTKELIKQARDILKQTGQVLKNAKIVPVPRSIIPNVANHVAMAQAVGHPTILTRAGPGGNNVNRAAALVKVKGLSAGPGRSWDEYPFASSQQGGAAASVVSVPRLENSIQGGIISAAYAAERINVGTPYYVLVIP